MYSERELIERLRLQFPAPGVAAGIGDDAAVLETGADSTLFCSDLTIENTHFRRETHPPDSIGFKAVAVNVSDIGAMGGSPHYFLLSLGLPEDIGDVWVDRLLSGIERACRDLGVLLVGGDTGRSEEILLDVAMIGSVPAGRHVLRSGARPGDRVYVTGSLGLSALGLTRLGQEHSDDAVRRHLFPEPRHRVGRALAGRATAMIDLSDGLSKDLGHILDASGVSACIDPARIPHAREVSLELALHGGEDYELLVTGRGLPAAIEGVPLTEIGEIMASEEENKAWLAGEAGPEVLEDRSWRHFG